MSFETRTVSVRDGMFNVEVRTAGQGEPFVWLHGGTGGPPGMEGHLLDLAAHYKVYRVTHPGWGDSTGLENIDDVVDMALFYLDLFDALGLTSVYLAGTSLGGMFAAEIAALGPQYVRKLVLAAAAGLWVDGVVPVDTFTISPDEMNRLAFYDSTAAAAMQPPLDPNDREAMARAMINRTKAGQATGKFIWPLWDKGLKKRIHRIKAPTLLVWGESDGLVPLVYGEEFRRRIPGSRLAVIPKAGHVPQVEQQAEFVRIVREFLTS